MATVFTQVLSCCLQRKPSKPKIAPDLEQPFITPELEPSSTSPDTYRVQRKIKERMHHIVRTKESKMVNVAARIPFNIHNKIYSSLEDDSLEESLKYAQVGPSASASPSYSRSGSTYSLPPSARFHNHGHHPIPPSPLTPISPCHNQNPKTRRPNLSRSSSMAFNRIPDEFYAEPGLEEEPDQENIDHSGSGSRSRMGSSSRLRSPPFRVRLVRGLAKPSDTSSGLATRRGRAKKRTIEAPSSLPEQSLSIQGVTSPLSTEINPTLSVSLTSTASSSSASTSRSVPEFKLQPSGPLVIGWDGDDC
ncbi:hypothetical protein CPB83DRAFT_604045 [Crepidotus variabilis]|uniref:Uncharacterized protein n=1 Tax=Crepidotus variabilis TaxID=179855 RepID=A0A9P6E925_9AGAR|nr:hypothetical protein CPB83DRAFT_604045 [Crepidotus variabilis]